MRWVPVWIVGAAAALAGWASGPPFRNSRLDSALGLELSFAWLGVLFYAPFFVAVVGGTVLAFRALWLSTRRAELAAHLALGRPRRALVLEHVRAGMRDGVLAGLGGVVIGGALRQIRTGFVGVEFVSNTLWDYTAFAVLAVVCFAFAYWIAALWTTRGSVRAIASGQAADAPAAVGARRTGRRGRRIVLWSALALGGFAVLLLVLSRSVLSADESQGQGAVVVAIFATIVVTVGLGIALPGLLVYVGAKVTVRATRAISRALATGTPPGSARSLASDGLSRPTPMRTGALSTVIAVMGVAVSLTATYFGVEDGNDVAGALAPHASVSTVDLMGGTELRGGPSGWAEPLPAGLVADLHADPTLTVIDAAVLIADPRDRELPDEMEGASFAASRDLLLAVDPEELDAVSPDASKRLYLTDGTQWMDSRLGVAMSAGPGDDSIEVDGVRADTAAATGHSPWAGISRPWAEDLWGTSPTAAVILYPAGDVPVSQALAAHDLDALEVVDFGASLESGGGASSGQVAAATAPFLALAVAIVVALAWSSQRLRARDQATLLALGATPAALRGAAALEAFTLTVVAALVGTFGGAIIGPVLAVVSSSAPLSTAGVGLVLWNVWHTLTIMPWGVLLGLALGTAAIAAAGAALMRVRLDRMSPAEQLAEAQKAGTP